MTEEKFLEMWDSYKDKNDFYIDFMDMETESWSPNEWLDEYQIDTVIDDMDLYKSAEWGKHIYAIGGRYFARGFVDGAYHHEEFEIEEVDKKTYSKRIEVTEWLSMPD